MKSKNAILKLLKNKRKMLSLSQEEFAERVNMSQSAYSKLESGMSSLTVTQLNKIFTELEINFVSEFPGGGAI